MSGDITYPHVIIRAMAAVYLPRTVEFAERPPQNEIGNSTFYVPFAGTASFDGTLSEAALAALIDELKTYSRTSKFRCVAVISKSCSCYVEPDGRETWTGEPPRGGIRF